MVLRVTAMKDGQECEKLILLKPHKQEIVRTRVEEIANPKDIVICEFEVEQWQGKILSVDAAEVSSEASMGLKMKLLSKI